MIIGKTTEEFRSMLVDVVKAAGQEVIDRAGDLVGEADGLSDFDIWLRFSINHNRLDALPIIEVTRSHGIKNSIKVLEEYHA